MSMSYWYLYYKMRLALRSNHTPEAEVGVSIVRDIVEDVMYELSKVAADQLQWTRKELYDFFTDPAEWGKELSYPYLKQLIERENIRRKNESVK